MATAAAGDLEVVQQPAEGLTRSGSVRVAAIDMLRGLVIVIMVLDHVRDFFHIDVNAFDPVDPARSYPLLFATRWITHLCAPTFVFLAGLSIFLQRANGKRGAALAQFLVLRGVWLIALECTIVSFGFNFGGPFLFLQVIWAIGASMICMAVIAQASSAAVLVLGAAIICLHPYLAQATEGATGAAHVLYLLALHPGLIPGVPILFWYAFIPWLGVMCLGFGLGPLFTRPPAERDAALVKISAAFLAFFIVLRVANGFGNPAPWTSFPEFARTAMSFMNVEKYPPSLDYVLATLGIAFLLFVALDGAKGWFAQTLLNFGRAPLLVYVAHIYIAHAIQLVVATATGRPDAALNTVSAVLMGQSPAPWGFNLWVVYLVWLVVVACLAPIGKWFAGVKQRRRDWWLSYL